MLTALMEELVGLKLMLPKEPGVVGAVEAVQVMYEGWLATPALYKMLAVIVMGFVEAGLRAFCMVTELLLDESVVYKLE